MGKKKNDKIKISFVGSNSYMVTGSSILIEYKDYKILLDCGLAQTNSLKNDYELNSAKFKGFKPRDIDYVFIQSNHGDHCFRTPKLYKEGCKAEVITTNEVLHFLEPMLLDSAFIMDRDAQTLSKTKGKEYEPIYTNDDVYNCLSYIRGYDMNKMYELNDNISFMYTPNKHLISSASLSLFIKKDNGNIVKIYYSEDIGNLAVDNYYVNEFQPVIKSTVAILETTYASKEKRSCTKKDREKDLEKIKTVVDTTCFDKKGKVIIPVFAFTRCQQMLTHLYDLFGKDENFDIPVIIDSPLAVKLTKIFRQATEGTIYEDKFKEVMNWKNIKLISDTDDSKLSTDSKEPAIVLSSSGMAHAGRVIKYIQKELPNHRSTILFCGYSAEGTLGWKIKNFKEQSTITVDGKICRNKASVVNLGSFSGHIQREDMLKYYSSLQTEKICLVHGNANDKLDFAKDLKERLEEQCKTTKVVVVNKDTEINL